MDHHQSILEASQQTTKIPVQFPKEQLNIAFTTTEGHDVHCSGNESAAHKVALDDAYVFMAFDDTPQKVLDHMLHVSKQSGRKCVEIQPCDWRKDKCSVNHLMRDCPIYCALSDDKKLGHILKSGRCFNCYKKGHRSGQCKSRLCCTFKDCGMKHNSALHKAWKAKTNAVSLLTKNVSPISLLTSPVMVATDNSFLKKETNVKHDNGASISLMDKSIADIIGLKGETRMLGLSTVGDGNVMKQAFRTSIKIHDAEGHEIGKAWEHEIKKFVDLTAVD
jgi:hypothetical protein